MDIGLGAIFSGIGVALKHGKTFFGVMTKSYVRYRNTDIVITGASGAGKSHLMDYIASEINQRRQTSQETSATVEHTVIALNKDWLQKKVSVIPGQSFKAREKAFVDLVSTNKGLKGIIHVVDWGYTKPKRKDFETYVNSKKIKTIDSLREDNLAEEIIYLESLADELHCRERNVSWFVIVLNKIDLFNAGEAVEYYRSNAKFCAALSRVLEKVDIKTNDRNMIQPICCVREDFEFNGKRVKTKLPNQEEQTKYYEDFRKTLEMNLAE
ncbi:hypothetical protein A3N68_14305 [Enterobacter asburiae]|uniref:GTPase n=1 Tax=Enterobacter asburiae TaxID=61645 RepID=UPI0007B3D4BC|nr:GTPase [Enterobacter asburiae]KZR46937.1 hypothetical protein A3N68_14305 [Enterobacter asburiae]